MIRSLNQLIASGKLPLKSQGASMMPLLLENDIVYFKKIPFSQIKVNDIIVFKKKKELICHRVIYKKPSLKKDSLHLITKGDNSPYADSKVYPHQILGKVYQVKRNGKIIFPETLYLIQSSQYLNEIIKIKKEFDKAGINYLFLKGLPLHLYFESRHPKRIYADCDVLIDKKDFETTKKILSDFRYVIFDQSLSKIHTLLRRKQIEVPFLKKNKNLSSLIVFDIHLELDWMSQQLGKLEELYPQTLINNLTKECLRSKKSIRINGEKFFVLNFEFLIIYLSLHLFHHNFTGAFRYQFLDTVIRRGLNSRSHRNDKKINWQRIAQKIKEYQLQNFVYPVFFLLKKHYHTPIPSSFLSSIKPSSVDTFTPLHKINIFNDEPRIRAGIKRFLYLFLLSPNPFYKKILVFFNPAVVYSILWVGLKKIFSIKQLIIHRLKDQPQIKF